MLKATFFETPIGSVVAVADEQLLYVLTFSDLSVEQEIALLQKNFKQSIEVGYTKILDTLKQELEDYFAGTLQEFKTPLALTGTSFQQQVWRKLQEIPYGQTISYIQLAKALDNPLACRAVGTANGANKLAIIVPCHRVINATGALGGYASGIDRKQWLFNHEKKFSEINR